MSTLIHVLYMTCIALPHHHNHVPWQIVVHGRTFRSRSLFRDSNGWIVVPIEGLGSNLAIHGFLASRMLPIARIAPFHSSLFLSPPQPLPQLALSSTSFHTRPDYYRSRGPVCPRTIFLSSLESRPRIGPTRCLFQGGDFSRR